MQQKRIYKLIIDGAKMLEFYRNNLRMVPQEIQPICQEMMVKMGDEVETMEKDNRKKLKTHHEPDFTSIVNKTKQHGRSSLDQTVPMFLIIVCCYRKFVEIIS